MPPKVPLARRVNSSERCGTLQNPEDEHKNKSIIDRWMDAVSPDATRNAVISLRRADVDVEDGEVID